MWTLAAVIAQIALVFPLVAVLAGRWAGLPAPTVRWGTGPPVARGRIGGVDCELGPLPLGSSVAFGEEQDVPLRVLLAPHLAAALAAAAAALASPDPTRRAWTRIGEWLSWSDTPYGPLGAIAHAWRADAVDPVGTAAAVVGVLSVWNLCFAVAQWLGLRVPPVSIGLVGVGLVVMLRACAVDLGAWSQ